MLTANPRTKLNYNPEFTGPIEGYVTNFLKRNFWRVEATMEYEDVLQEAYIVFLRTSRKYSVAEAKHFMSLYKTAWANAFVDLANHDSKLRTIPCLSSVTLDDEDEAGSGYDTMGDTDNAGGLLIALEQAPREVREVIRLLVSAPVELLDMAHRAWKGNGKNIANGNHLINQALGRPSGTDSIGPVERYFTESSV